MSDLDLPPLDPALEKLIELDTRAEAVPAERASKIRANLAPLLGAATPSAPSSPDPTTARSLDAGKWVARAKLGAALVVAAAAGAAGHALLAPSPAPTVVYVDRVVPAVPLPTAPPDEPKTPLSLPSSTPSQLPNAVAPSRALAPASSTTATVGRDFDLAGERAVLEVAKAALGRKDGEGALEAVARYEKAHPRGQLREEAEAIAIQALAMMGRRDEALARAGKFRQTYPNGFFGPVLDQALGRRE